MKYERTELKRTLPAERGEVHPKDEGKVSRKIDDGWTLYSISGETYRFRRPADYEAPEEEQPEDPAEPETPES